MAWLEVSVAQPGSAFRRFATLRSLHLLPRLHTRDAFLFSFLTVAVMLRFWAATDPDYWWHVRTGEIIVNSLAVPTHDPFSFTADGVKWIDHEWLSQVLLYGLLASVGYGLSVFLFALIGATSILLMSRLMRQLNIPEPLAIGLTILGIVVTFGFWTVRPNAFSLLLTAVFLAAAFGFVRRQQRSLWLLVPLMLLWANLHGGYVVGLGILALLGIAEASRWRQGQQNRLGHVALVAVLAFIATGVNPYTYHLWPYPLTYFFGDNASLELIAEWQPPRFFHDAYTYPLGFAILALMALSATAKKVDLWRISLAVVFTALVMQSVRHQSLFGLMLMPVLGELAVATWPSMTAAARRVEHRLVGLGSSALVAVLLAAAVYFVVGSGEQAHREPSAKVGSVAYPVEGAQFIQANFPRARMLNHYNYGGYLIYALGPEIPVFIDGRADVYGRARVEDFQAMTKLKPGWRDLLDRYQIGVVLFPTNSPLIQALSLDEGWVEAFRGEQESVFARAAPVTAP